jgi:capsular exopolysaccharide synthesis family protein
MALQSDFYPEDPPFQGGQVAAAQRRSAASNDRFGQEADGFLEEPVFGEERRLEIAAIWGAILKHRWVIGSVLATCLVLGLAVTLLTQPLFTAKTTIQIDRESSKIVEMTDLAPREALTGAEFLDTQIGLLKSDTLARRVVQTLQLASDPEMRQFAGLESAGALPDSRVEDRLTGLVMSRTSVRQQGLSRLVNLDFTSPSPELSARIANALAENFQTLSLERRFESSSYARQFLEERLAQVKQKLEDSEKELVAYGAQQQIINVSPGGAGAGAPSDTASQSLTAADLSAINSMLTAAKGERIRAEQRWRQSQSMSILSQPEALSDPTIQALLQQRAKLASIYQEQLKVFGPGMPDMEQLKAQMEEVDRQLAAAGESIRSSIRSRFEVARSQELSLASQVEGLKGSFINLRERNIKNTILQREVDTNRSLYDGLLQRYKEVGVAGGVGNNNVSVVDRARPPSSPSSPKLPINMAIALVAGLALAGAATLILELLDEAIRTPDDLTTKIGLTTLGVIPVLEKGATPLQAFADPRSNFAEAYASARTALQFASSSGAPGSLLITSSRPSEGKSTTSTTLGRSFAQLGLSVLLVDADLRNPSIHRLMGVNNAVGLSNFLTGTDLQQVLQAAEQPGLEIIGSGPLPPNPVELLAGPRLMELLRLAQTRFDMVILDGPPIIGLADAPILAARAAATLLVVESAVARRSVVRMAIRRLVQARANILGAVLTKFDAQTAGYGYGYGYGHAYAYQYGGKRLQDDAA